MFNTVKEKLYSVVQEVQNPKRNEKFENGLTPNINLDAGADILSQYQKQWKEIHEDTEKNSHLAETVDAEMTKIHSSVDKQLYNVVTMNAALAKFPQLNQTVDQCVINIKELLRLAQTVENDLVNLEDLIERGDFKRRQYEHSFQLTMYKEKKFAEFEKSRITLAKQQAGAAKEMELRQRKELLERQRIAQEAFLKDLNRYKTKGELPKTDDKESIENSAKLEDIHLSCEDTTALDEFLNK